MVAVVQPGVAARSGDVVVATIDRADSIMRRMTVINGDLILSPKATTPTTRTSTSTTPATTPSTWST